MDAEDEDDPRRSPCEVLGGCGEPCMSPDDREEYEDLHGEECIRREPFHSNGLPVGLGQDLLSHAAESAGLGEWLWRTRTRGLDETLRLMLFDDVNLYMGKFKSAAHEYYDAQAKVRRKTSTVPKRRQGKAGVRRIGKRR